MEQGTKRGDYYLGLDMGTDSVGWAVTDMDYRIPKFKGNAMWGVRLFDESNTAEERRLFRISRRRTQRRRERLDLLEMLFDGPVSTKDPAFFQRLRESDLYAEDKPPIHPLLCLRIRIIRTQTIIANFPPFIICVMRFCMRMAHTMCVWCFWRCIILSKTAAIFCLTP